MRVLTVDESPSGSRVAEGFAKSLGAVTDMVGSGREALELAKHYDYDIILLSLDLTDIDGLEVIKRIRTARITTPIIVVASQNRSNVKVKALSLGADDFVLHPIDTLELNARIQAVIRRSKGFSQSIIDVGPLRLNLSSREVHANGMALHLTGKEYAILELLVLRKGMVLTKEVFLNHLYGGMDEPEMKIIDVFVCKLRKKLSIAGADGLIATVWGRGYMMRDLSADRSTSTMNDGAHLAIRRDFAIA